MNIYTCDKCKKGFYSKPALNAHSRVHGHDHKGPTKNLSKLLDQVVQLFDRKEITATGVFDFSLGKFPDGWSFEVTNSWHKWNDRGFEFQFGKYAKPENAVVAFLDYVRKNNVPVSELMES